ncbi:MAG TPA: RsmE family RNA methyltransferase [Phycisphaerales bacterium]|nr:RsmE family RNA methyltransferase [Phycisphaerales bacterium]
MSTHRIHISGEVPQAGDRAEIDGPEAHHAVRVKRLGEGDTVELINGRGWRGLGVVREIRKTGKGEWVLAAEVRQASQEAPPSPGVHVLAPAPKGERLDEMIDQLSQVGAASWAPLMTARTVVSPREGKLIRAERIAAEAAKQCGRLWTMEIGPPAPFAQALARQGTRLVLADASGGPFVHLGDTDITLLVGPEGGFADDEVRRARDAGACVCGFGRHVMRVETAAPVAAGIIVHAADRGASGVRALPV